MNANRTMPDGLPCPDDPSLTLAERASVAARRRHAALAVQKALSVVRELPAAVTLRIGEHGWCCERCDHAHEPDDVVIWDDVCHCRRCNACGSWETP